MTTNANKRTPAALVGTNTKKIFDNTLDILNNETIYATMSEAHNPYGDGLAAQRIADTLLKFL